LSLVIKEVPSEYFQETFQSSSGTRDLRSLNRRFHSGFRSDLHARVVVLHTYFDQYAPTTGRYNTRIGRMLL
jgi:hypothetical protein